MLCIVSSFFASADQKGETKPHGHSHVQEECSSIVIIVLSRMPDCTIKVYSEIKSFLRSRHFFSCLHFLSSTSNVLL